MRAAGRESGSLILLVAVLMALMSFALIGYQFMSFSSQSTTQRLNASAQADSVARSGLVDALQWFRRQTPQPVANALNPDAAFAPLASSGDTIDQTIGLVKQYALSDQSELWARYEVRYGTTTANGSFSGVHDISDRRTATHSAGEGLVWSLQSVGYVYRQVNASLAFNQAPNQIMATTQVTTELRRLTLALPIDAAAIIVNLNSASFANNSQLIGGSYALAYYTGTAPADDGNGNSYTPMYHLTGGTQTIATDAIFTAPIDQVRGMADVQVAAGQPLPNPYPVNQIVFVDGDATFDNTHPLTGSGLLIVNGNLTVNSSANALFSGLIYVTGSASVYGPAQISGALVIQGTLACDGGQDTVTLQYDTTVLNSLRQQVGMYRTSHSLQYTFSAGATR